MFVDTSAVVAILLGEEDARDLSQRLENARQRLTSPLVILEATMRLSTKLDIDLLEVETMIDAFLAEGEIEIVPIGHEDGRAAVRAFAQYGKGRGHPARLNLADCLSYACAKNRNLPLLYKGGDFAQTDLR